MSKNQFNKLIKNRQIIHKYQLKILVNLIVVMQRNYSNRQIRIQMILLIKILIKEI